MSEVFVFGSNLAGRHGIGSAKAARTAHGAIYGQGSGRQGNSYAIPTKGYRLEVLPLRQIAYYVDQFLKYADINWTDNFNVVAIGCGLAGYMHSEIGPLFKGAPKNVKLPPEFEPYR